MLSWNTGMLKWWNAQRWTLHRERRNLYSRPQSRESVSLIRISVLATVKRREDRTQEEKEHTFLRAPKPHSIFRFFFFLQFDFFFWSIVDLSCCISFRYTAQWLNYIHFFQILFPYRLLQNVEYSSLFYTVGPCWLSVLYIVTSMP